MMVEIHKDQRRNYTQLLVVSIVLIIVGVLLVIPGFVFLVRLLNGGDDTDFGLSFGLLVFGGTSVVAGILSSILTVGIFVLCRFCCVDMLSRPIDGTYV